MNDFTDDFPLDNVAPAASHYLQKGDVTEAGRILTVAGIGSAELDNDGKPEIKHILKFAEDCKPMVLNVTNRELLKQVTGATTVGQLKGKRITVYNDPSVMFGGRMTGGLRIKAAPEPVNQDSKPNDDIPF